jgi:signal transduction histidine kinase
MRIPAKISDYNLFFRNYFRQILMTSLALILIGITLYFFASGIGKPFMGIVVSMNNSTWSVESVDPNGTGHLSGFRAGDIPLAINGQPAAQFLDKYTHHKSVNGFLIKEIRVVDENGQIKQADLKGSSVPAMGIAEDGVMLFTCIIFWSIGLFVFFKRPEKPAAILLCLVGLVFSLVLGGTVAAERTIAWAGQLSVIATIIGPWILLHFFLVQPEEPSKITKSKWTYLIYLLPAITIVLNFWVGNDDGQPLPWFRTLRLLEVGAVLLAVIMTAVINYARSHSPRTRQQMKIMAISCVAALVPFIIIYLLPQLILKRIIFPSGLVMFLAGIIPIGMGYAVVTRRLWDIDVIIRRGVVYGLISVIMSIFLAAGILPAMSLLHNTNIWQELAISLIIGISGTALFGPVKSNIEKYVDKLFYKDRFDYRQIIQRLSVALNNYQELTDISRLIVGTAVRTLNLAGACLILKNQSDVFEVNACEGSLADPEKRTELLSMVHHRDPGSEFPNPARPIDADLAFFVPLWIWKKEIGFLCIGPKISRQDFAINDIYLLGGLSSVAATALQNAMLSRDVSLRDTFVSIASHELRTPLTSIVGYTELLLRKEVTPETRQQWLKIILDNGQKITDMVNDLLNVTRIHSGKINIKLSEINLSELIEERLPLYKESTNKHSFTIDLPEDLPTIAADRDKIGQIFGNLLSNAVKYSPNGGNITISARSEPEKERVVMGIKDQGMGISQEDKGTLFKTFHRIQRPETRGIRGSGLGLYIVKEWTQAIGGEIWLTSELNRGSTFFVAFPSRGIII